MRKLLHFFHGSDYAVFAVVFIVGLSVAARMELIFDESIYLQIPLRLAREASYSLIYPIDEYNGLIGATLGPTVLLPIGLVFELLGTGVVRARLISCLYFAGALSLFWVLAARSQSRITGILFLLSLFSIPSIFLYGVTVHGEVPALFFVLLGTVLWKPNHRNLIPLICFGLAAVTKTYFLLYALPVLGMITLEGRRAGGSLAPWFGRAFSSILLFLMPSLVWELAKFFFIGPERYAGYLASSSTFVSGKFSEQLNWEMVRERLAIVFEGALPAVPVYAAAITFLVVFIFYIARLIVNREPGPADFLFLGLATFTTWYLFLSSFGWWRFFFPFALVFMFLLFNLLQTVGSRFSGSAPAWKFSSAAVFLVVFSIFIIRPVVERVPSFFDSTRLDSQRAFADKVLEYNDLGYRFGVWGWWQAPEISFLAGGTRFGNIQFDCQTSLKRNVLIVYTGIHVHLEPKTAASFQDCTGELLYTSPDGGYFLYEPVRNEE